MASAPKDRANDPKRQPTSQSGEVNPALIQHLKDLKGMDTESAMTYIQRWKNTFGNK